MRRLAASMLAITMNVLGLQGFQEAEAADDADDDRIECVEFTRDRSNPASRHILAAATDACRTPILGAWIAASHHEPQLAIALGNVRDSVATVEVVSPSGEPSRDSLTMLLSRALDYADARGALKVVIETDGIAPQSVREAAEGLGWQFWRYRDHDGAAAVELMRDLYFKPGGSSESQKAYG